MIEVFFIKSLANSYFEKTYNSFLTTIAKEEQENFKIHTVRELETREQTLNTILKLRNKQYDLLVVADDILFTENWFKNLKQNLGNGDVIGFSMAKPDKDKISNRGFEFVRIGDRLTYFPLNKGGIFSVSDSGFVECDFVTGCLMFVKTEVLEHCFNFQEEGFNRWGEILFATYAKQKGFTVICLNHTVYHEAISTKNKSKIYSSTSYLVEQNLWNIVCEKYLNSLKNIRQIEIEIENKLQKLVENEEEKLIYGCGTVCDYILSACKFQNITLVSGLKEEYGLAFHGLKVLNIQSVNLNAFKHIINTAIGYERQVKEQYFKSYQIITLKKFMKKDILLIGLVK